MAELVPATFPHLLRRMLREWEHERKVFDLPARRFWRGSPDLDTSVLVHGHRVANPAGPAAGPHGQMAQNVLLSWLAGGRFIELKTVQVNDRLTIPRPCIDMETVGYNVEVEPGAEAGREPAPVREGLMYAVSSGQTMIMVRNARDIHDLLLHIDVFKPTIFMGVPALYNAINLHPDVAAGKYDLSSIRACISGSAPLAPETKRRFEELTGGKVAEGAAEAKPAGLTSSFCPA